MFFAVYENRSGEEYVRRVAPNETLDCRAMVRQWADREGYAEAGLSPVFSEPGAHIGSGCADYQAEIRRVKVANASCWDSEPFYLVGADE